MKGFILTLDGLLSVTVSFILFSLMVYLLSDIGVSGGSSVDSGIALYMSSAQRMGVFNDYLATENSTIIQEVADYPAGVFCVNITVLDRDDVLTSAVTTGCTVGETVHAFSFLIVEDGAHNHVRALGWKN